MWYVRKIFLILWLSWFQAFTVHYFYVDAPLLTLADPPLTTWFCFYTVLLYAIFRE